MANFSTETFNILNKIDANIRKKAIYKPELRDSLSMQQMNKIKEKKRKRFEEKIMK